MSQKRSTVRGPRRIQKCPYFLFPYQGGGRVLYFFWMASIIAFTFLQVLCRFKSLKLSCWFLIFYDAWMSKNKFLFFKFLTQLIYLSDQEHFLGQPVFIKNNVDALDAFAIFLIILYRYFIMNMICNRLKRFSWYGVNNRG